MIDDEKKLDALIEQCKSIDSKITSYHVMSARVLGIGIAIVSGVLAVSIKEKSYIVLLLLPLALYSILFYWTNVMAWIVANGGYKKHLEEKINKVCREPLFLWEAGIVQKRHTNISNICLNSLYVVVLILCVGSSIFAASKYPNLVIISIGVNLFLLIALIISFVHLKNEFNQAYLDSKNVEKKMIQQFEEDFIANKANSADAKSRTAD